MMSGRMARTVHQPRPSRAMVPGGSFDQHIGSTHQPLQRGPRLGVLEIDSETALIAIGSKKKTLTSPMNVSAPALALKRHCEARLDDFSTGRRYCTAG